MNKVMYMSELQQRLSPLPLSKEDIADAMQYYEEYFSEAGVEKEQEVIAELGSPAYVAAQIALKLSSSPTPLSAKKKGIKKNMSVLWMVLLGIMTAPVALPLALSAAIVVMALIFSAFTVVLSIGASGIICMVASVMTSIYSITMLTSDFATAIYFIGVSLFSFGIGGLMTRFAVWLAKISIQVITRISARILRREKPKTISPINTN